MIIDKSTLLSSDPPVASRSDQTDFKAGTVHVIYIFMIGYIY